MNSQQQNEECGHIFSKRLIALNVKVLKNYKISRIIYAIIKVLQYMQLCYFALRIQETVVWNYAIIKYFILIINNISVDYLIKEKSQIYLSITYAFLVILLIVITIMALWMYFNIGKKTHMTINIVITFLVYMLFMFKTILVIPCLQIIIINLIPQILKNLSAAPGAQISNIFKGIIILILFFILQIYIIYLCRQQNPFSHLNHTGQTITQSILMFILKVILVIYSLADLQGTFQTNFNIIYTCLLLIKIIYNIKQPQLYKPFQNNIERSLLNFLFVITFLQTVDYYLNYQLTTLTFLIPFFLCFQTFMRWIDNNKAKRILQLNLVINQSLQKLIELIVYLITLTDSIQNRQSRIKLQGYLNFHRRYCRIGQSCHCKQLQALRQRQQENLKLKFFKLLIDILFQNKKKFPESKKIDFFLGLIFHYRIKNSLQAIYAFSKTTANFKSTLIDRFYVAFYLEHVEEEMKQSDEKQFNKTFQINKYLQYSKKLLIFQQNIQSCTKNHVQFWRLILDNHPEIKRLQDLGTILTKEKDHIKQYFERIFFYNPNSIHLLTVYGKFLLEVTNEQFYNVKYLQKAEVIFKNLKYASKVDQTSNKYNQNSQTLVIVISGNQKQLGTVVHTNNILKDLLLYRKNQIIDKNIANLMPKFYGEHHNAVLARYISVSESKVNGLERIVPALNKDGYICPATALTKVLPSLDFGIQIVGFLAKLQQKLFDEDDLHDISYFMYRTDNQQILGISERCYRDFHINPCLVYGNPYNINNQLKIKDLFGISFQKTNEGKIASALQVGQVCLQINTKKLKDDFIITNGSMKNEFLQQQQSQQKLGVEANVVIKTVVTNYYFGVTVKLIAMYKKQLKSMHKLSNEYSYKKASQILKYGVQKSKILTGNQETDDIKNLKDFKNFISIKRQPSAISTLSAICFLLILIVCGSVSGLIVNWLQIQKINKNMIQLDKIVLHSQLFMPEIMSQTQKKIISLSSTMWNITQFTPYNDINKLLINTIALSKNSILKTLPFKYFFDESYNKLSLQYKLLSNGKIISNNLLLQQTINNYLGNIETIAISNISSLQNFTINLNNNVYQKYESSKLTQIYSLRKQLNISNYQNWNEYKNLTNSRSLIIIIVTSMMMFFIILWLICVLPYVLSVTKINNRVLSLFSLIPYAEICKLIYACLNYMHGNLTEATVQIEDLKYYQEEQNSGTIDKVSQLKNSPTQFGLIGQSFTHTSMMKMTHENRSLNKRNDKINYIEQKFERMKNSEDRSKNIVIFKFILISLLLLGFAIYYLLYSLSVIKYTETTLLNYHYLGRRPALIRNVKLLMFQYLINPKYQPESMSSIKNLNRAMITEFYNLQANLLSLNFQTYEKIFNDYNNNDICKSISTYSRHSLFSDTFNSTQCLSVLSKILEKGLKTSVVGVLQDIRSVISQENMTKNYSQIVKKILEYETLTKYIETPMLAVLSQAQAQLTKTSSNSSIVIIVTGSIFLAIILLSWRIFWTKYLQQLNLKIWRTKGLLNLIPMKIITMNDMLKNEFTSGQLQMAIR